MQDDTYERNIHKVSLKFLFVHVLKQVKPKFTLEQAMKAQWGRRDIALLFL
jgi:hypothetical protein